MSEYVTRNAQGVAAGRKGRETRQRILNAVEERFLRAHHRTIKVSEIAAAAGTSSATFYYYFPDLAAAAAEAAQRQVEMLTPVVSAASRLVDPAATEQEYEFFIRSFYEYWTSRKGMLEAIVEASEGEDPRFFRVLLRAMMSVTYALAPAVKDGHPVGVAGSLVMMLTSSAARLDGFQRDGVPYDALIASQVRIMRAALLSATP